MVDLMYKYKICYKKSNHVIREINGCHFEENVNTIWLSDEFADKIIYIEQYSYNSKILNQLQDFNFRRMCNIKLNDILHYIDDIDCCTVHIVLFLDEVVQAYIYPNKIIENKFEMFSIESCAGYGDELFVEYVDDYDTFTPCEGWIGKKVKKAMQQ